MPTIDMWETLDNYEPFISDIVIQEASKGDQALAGRRLKVLEDFQVLRIDDEAKVLARLFLTGKAIPQNCPEDALHIAVAAVNGIDIIVTWNFKHINNPFTKIMIRQLIENEGYVCPGICSPDEFLGDEI